MSLTALDLFSGGGGISLGLHAAGFDVHGVELHPYLASLQRLNGLSCESADVTTYHPSRSYDLVAGGPPCPAFSYAGKREGTSVEQGRLFEHLLRVAVEANARCVLMENVEGLLTAEDGTAIHKVKAAFGDAGYRVYAQVFDCSRYRVPQRRKRLLLVGVREELSFAFPAPIDRPVSVREALGLRGAYAAGRVERAQSSRNGKERGWWQGGRALDVSLPGYTVGTRDNYDLLVPEDDVARAEVEAMRVRSGRKPSPGGYRLNVEELKVLQGAPAYRLAGKMSEQHYAIGNMVPPPLAEAVGRSLALAL